MGGLLPACPVDPGLLHGGGAAGDPSMKPLSEICIQISDRFQPSSNFCRCFEAQNSLIYKVENTFRGAVLPISAPIGLGGQVIGLSANFASVGAPLPIFGKEMSPDNHLGSNIPESARGRASRPFLPAQTLAPYLAAALRGRPAFRGTAMGAAAAACGFRPRPIDLASAARFSA